MANIASEEESPQHVFGNGVLWKTLAPLEELIKDPTVGTQFHQPTSDDVPVAENKFLPSSDDIGTRSFFLLGAGFSNLLRAFATVVALPVTTVDIGMLLSGEILGAVVAVLRGVDAGDNLSVFSVLTECARMTESIMKSKAARTTSGTTLVSARARAFHLSARVPQLRCNCHQGS